MAVDNASMRRQRWTGAIRLLVGAIAVLLPAAALGAVTVGPAPVSSDGRVGAAGFDAAAFEEEQARATTSARVPVVASTTTTTTPRPATATTRTTLTTTSTTRPPQGATGATLPPGVPWPSLPPATGIPNVPPASSWSAERDGVSAQMRIEPTTPTAGQPVRFLIEVSSAEPCCTVMLDFGDGSTGYSLNNGRLCEGATPLTPGRQSVTTSHTYATAGAYKASLAVLTGDSCTLPPMSPGSAPSPPFLHSASITGCLAVGPGTAGQAGCSPFPTFGPGSIISPVLDPFCQVRSDCTKPSPPR